MRKIDNFDYLWADPAGPWVLVAFENSEDPPAIFNRDTREALVVEDDELYVTLVDRMRDAGVPLIDSLS